LRSSEEDEHSFEEVIRSEEARESEVYDGGEREREKEKRRLGEESMSTSTPVGEGGDRH
jgi:hypothetical protein